MSPHIGDTAVTLRLRPARIQRAAETAVERQIANVNRVMNLPDEELWELATVIRRLAEGEVDR